MTDEASLFAAMRAAKDDDAPKLVYADWLLERGDERGELIVLDHRERTAGLHQPHEIERLLELAVVHGFPRLPDDPDARILPFTGGGSHPTQYDLTHEGHNYYVRWRYGFSIDVDDVEVFEGELDTQPNDLTFRETNVVLSILSDAILRGTSLASLTFPDQSGFRAHPDYRPGKTPNYGFPAGFLEPRGLMAHEDKLRCRDHPRWYLLWERLGWLRGPRTTPAPVTPLPGCACGLPRLGCYVRGCDPRRR